MSLLDPLINARVIQALFGGRLCVFRHPRGVERRLYRWALSAVALVASSDKQCGCGSDYRNVFLHNILLIQCDSFRRSGSRRMVRTCDLAFGMNTSLNLPTAPNAGTNEFAGTVHEAEPKAWGELEIQFPTRLNSTVLV